MLDIPFRDWVVFHVVVVVMILLDLKLFEHEDRDPSFREVLAWAIVWISVGVSYGLFILWQFGHEAAMLYYTAYIVEETLSLDNMFVFFAIFTYFGVRYRYQHKVLMIGIVTAVVLRAVFIYGGIVLLESFHWMIYVFGAILIYSGVKLTKGVDEEVDPEKNPIVRYARRVIPIVTEYQGSKFVIKQNGKKFFTPMILVLLAIETTDVIFAVDSVPAVLAITTEFYIAYTSNIMAILGLRALYMLIAKVMYKLEYLNIGLGVLLSYLGIKMIASGVGYKIPMYLSIAIIITILSVSLLVSIVAAKRKNTKIKEKEVQKNT